jgi:predicted HTH transcriptional regulator
MQTHAKPMIAHKDYSSGSPIQISVYADKLMILNSGTILLPEPETKLRATQLQAIGDCLLR